MDVKPPTPHPPPHLLLDLDSHILRIYRVFYCNLTSRYNVSKINVTMLLICRALNYTNDTRISLINTFNHKATILPAKCV